MPNSKLTVPELAAVDVHGMTRSSFVLRGALAAGAVYGMGVVGPFVQRSFAQEGTAAPDADILNFALTLEILEATFYDEALKRVGGLSGDARALTEQLAEDEAAHVDALTAMIKDLGGQPTKAPKLDFGDAFEDEGSYFELAQDFEDTGVSAYNGAATAIQSKDVLEAAGTIVQVEGRHAALIRAQRGEEIAPTAFDDMLRQNEVLDKVAPFIKS